MTAEFNILDLNRVQKLFNMGMRPVFRHSDDTIWRRIPTIPITQLTADKGGMNMKFQFTFSRNNDTLMSSAGAVGTIQNPARAGKYYFAYCRPYSYTDCQNKIESIEKSLKSNSGIYFHRSVLCESSDGRNLDLLTITSNDGMSDGQEPLIPGLFPNLTETCALFRMSDDAASSKNLAGSPRRKNKSYFFLTARVHPGETISSYILDGFIDYLVSADKGAALLRSLFVFKIIPMLNPDGVYRGHYRGDADGVNLNRAYQNATPDLYPTIWATKHYISTLHEECGPVEWFIDLHGHANKPGCFMFGNWIFDLRKQYDMHLFAKCMLNNSTLFDLNECEFAPKEMIRPSTSRGYPSNQGPEMECTKDGTSRVGIFKAIGIHHCYTFEANYHGTRADKRIPRNDDSVEWKKGVRDNRFTLGDIHGMGKSIALAVADFCSPKRGGSFFRNDSAISVAQKWAAEQLKQMYHTAMVPIDEVQLKSSRLC